jgi:hypothetical protein
MRRVACRVTQRSYYAARHSEKCSAAPQGAQGQRFVRTRTDGRVRTCTIEPNALRTAEDWIAERRTSWETKRDPLGALLHKS